MKTHAKKLLFIVLAITFCLSSLSGCNQTEEIVLNVDWNAIPNATFPESPPIMIVTDGKSENTVWWSTYSWYVVEDGKLLSGKEVCGAASPLSQKDNLQAITLSKRCKLMLAFEVPPTSVTVKRYKLSATDYNDFKEIEYIDETITARAGDYLYEVHAHWDDPDQPYSGTAYYSFRTTK